MQFITPSQEINHPKLQKIFTAKEILKAELRITGLGLYRAFLNGKRIGTDYLTPGFNDYDAYLRYQSYDVVHLLQEGENILEVFLGDGWYKGRLCWGDGITGTWGDQYLLAAELSLIDADQNHSCIITDDSWTACSSVYTFSNIYDGEKRDDTRNSSQPVSCKIIDTKYNLIPQFSPCIRQVAKLKPKLIITPAKEQVLDFEQNAAGIFRFINRLPYGKTVHLQTGEVLQDGNFYNANLRSAKSEYYYTSDGVEKEIEPFFTFFGFRYIKVSGIDHVNPDDFTFIVLSSDLENTLSVETSNSKLNRLMANSLWGQRSNFVDVPTDCPQRDERLGWTADTQVYVNTACYQMDCREFYHKFLMDMRADQTLYLNGDLPQYSPSLKGRGSAGGAVWADAGTIVPWNLYQNYGDLEALKQHYPIMRDYSEHLIFLDTSAGGTHKVYNTFTFGDWLAQDGLTPQSDFGGTEPSFIQGIYYMQSIELTSKAAELIGESSDAVRYSTLAREIREALLDEYITLGGRLAVDTQCAYVLALRHGLWRSREKLIEGMKNRLRRDFYRIKCGFTGAPLLLPLLMDNGMEDIACRMLLYEGFPGWLYEVNLGATTIWERWNSLDENGKITGISMNSLNHYAYGSVCEAIYSRIIGLRNDAPGWKKAVIHPCFGAGLSHASISYRSASGTYCLSWKLTENNGAELTVSVPEGCTATVILPDHPDHFTEVVAQGTYHYQWKTTCDRLHPFTAQALMMDIMNHHAAAEVLRQIAPELYQDAANTQSETQLSTLDEATKIHCTPKIREKLLNALAEVSSESH